MKVIHTNVIGILIGNVTNPNPCHRQCNSIEKDSNHKLMVKEMESKVKTTL